MFAIAILRTWRLMLLVLIAGSVCTTAATASAAEIWLVTDRLHPISNAGPDIRVIELDAPARIQAELAAHLPSDPARAAAIVHQRLSVGGIALQQHLSIAQRAGDVVTRRGQPHVYRPLLPQLALSRSGYWPAGALIESDETTGKWQELVPTLSSSCAVFPNTNQHMQAIDGGYTWSLWRPYRCCKPEGQLFLGSVDFDTVD